MSVSECVKFEQKLAYFMAPSLLGIKCASLMSINKTEFSVSEHLERFNARAHAKGLKLRLLCDCTNRALILLYQETLLQQQLQNSQVQLILRQQGYDLSIWRQRCSSFPNASAVQGNFPTKSAYFWAILWKM